MSSSRVVRFVVLFAMISVSASAGVFNTSFEDVALSTGSGFDDSTAIPLHSGCNATTLGALRRCTAERALADLGALIQFAPGAAPDILFTQAVEGGPAAAGSATDFYNAALGNPQGGYLHRHITTGSDASPGVDAKIAINFLPLINGVPTVMNPDYLIIDQLDLYTVVLHEALHALGIASLIRADGASALTGSTAGPYAIFDQFLVRGGTITPLVSGFSPSFTGAVADLTSNALEYTDAINSIPRLPVTSASPFVSGVNLSHFDRFRQPADHSGAPFAGLTIDYVVGSGKPLQTISNAEQEVLCNLGYDLGVVCVDRHPLGFADTGPAVAPGGTVCVNVLANDFDAEGHTLSIDAGSVQIMNGNGVGANLAIVGGQLCYTAPAAFAGTAALVYRPSDGMRSGYDTVVTIPVTATSCPGDPCNLICNGGFEGGVPDATFVGFDAMKACPSMVDNWCATRESPDLFIRNSPWTLTKIPNNIWSGSCGGGVETWNFPAPGNNRYVAMGAEGMSAPLIQPLVPGRTYRLTFHALTNQATGVDGDLVLGFTSAEPAHNTIVPTSLDFALPQQTIPRCNGTNNWTAVTLTFTAPTGPVLRYFVIEGTDQSHFVYVDDFRLEEDGPPITVTTAFNATTVHAGDTVTYLTTVCNTGTAAATNVVVNMTLPSGLTTSGNTTQTLASLAPGCVTLTLQVLVTPVAPAATPLTTCALLASGGSSCGGSGSSCASVTLASTAVVSGSKFDDADGDGVWDSGEAPLPGWTITLTDANGVTTSTVTDAGGAFTFPSVAPGSYILSEQMLPGWVQTFPGGAGTHALSVTAGAVLANVNFGNQTIAPPVCVPPPPGLRAWWTLDEASGSLAHDLAGGNDDTGTHMNVPLIVPGMVGNALHFNGSNQYVEAADGPELDAGTGDLTIDAWIRTTAGDIQSIVDKRSNDPIGYAFFLVDGRLGFQLADRNLPGSCGSNNTTSPCTNWIVDPSATPIHDGAWHFVAVTVDRDDPQGGRLWVDGTIALTFDPTSRPLTVDNAAPLSIGRRHANAIVQSELFFNGDIDEVELFGRALGAGEVQAIHAAGSAGKCKSSCGNASLIQSDYYAQGNFEVVVPEPTGGIRHYWRNNDDPAQPWIAQALFGTADRVEAVSLIQGNLGRNFEVVARIGDKLAHYWRDNNDPAQTWHGPVFFATGVAGTPSLIQSSYYSTGNFEVVVPLAAGGFAHYWRDNDAAVPVWHAQAIAGASEGFIHDLSLIQSNYGAAGFPGNFEVVARIGDRLAHFWRDNSDPAQTWHGPVYFATGVSGTPALLQSRFGARGDFEVVAPLAAGGMAHYRRDNDNVAQPWLGPVPFGAGSVRAVSLIQSNYGDNFEVVAQLCDRLVHYWRDSTAAQVWHGPVQIAP